MPILDLGEINASFNIRVPVGTIVIWSGTIDNIPKGWHLCDGTGGTPDLRDKFVVGAGNEYQPKDEGGEKEVTLTIGQMPNHKHILNYYVEDASSWGTQADRIDVTDKIRSNSTAQPDNNVRFTGTSGSDKPHNNLPPYYALAYIMKLTADETDLKATATVDNTIGTPHVEVTVQDGKTLDFVFSGIKGEQGEDGSTGVGQSMEGKKVKPTVDSEVTAGEGAEIFNDYRERLFNSVDVPIQGNVASGKYSHAEGTQSTASGSYSHAEGLRTTSSGHYSHAEGENTIASGSDSHAEGQSTVASGIMSHAEGYNTTASGNYSHAGGGSSVASGHYSHAAGYNIIAHYMETVIGRFSVDSGASDTSSASVISFLAVGKGSSINTRSNAFRVASDGVYGTEAFKNSGADYAEMFEWEDGNLNNEDRVGRFVTLHGEKIRFANAQDDFILGIVSGNPSIVGDDHEDMWQGMYVRDVFGRHIFEDVWVEDELDPDGNVIVPAHMETREKINPNYDHAVKYVGRQNRPEWSAVGMVGKLVMIDDGSCQIDGWCKPGDGGVATFSQDRTRYRVISRLDETHVKILIL